MKSHIYIAPPGAGKTTFKKSHPGVFIDPEESIDWDGMRARHCLYKEDARRCFKDVRLEHELDWPTIWVKEILPRLRAAIILGKDVLTGMVTPSNVEIFSRFLSAFQKETTIILPNEEKHFEQVYGDQLKRARTWGPHLRGWQHTYWIRILLLGLAEDLDLKIVKQPILPKKTHLRKAGLMAREVIESNQRKFIEVFFGRWAEVGKDEEIIAMYIETAINENGIQIKCDRTSKVCGRKLHNCEETILLKKDVSGHDLVNWIAQDKIKLAKSGKKNALIFFVGTLAPFHRGHLEALNLAKSFLEKEGWNVIGGYASAFTNIKENRVEDFYSVLGQAKHRSNILQLGTMLSDWLMADFPTDHVLSLSLLERGKHPMQLLAKRLREHGALTEETTVTTFWVNGTDGVMKPEFFGNFAKYADADKFNPLRMLIIDNRQGKDEWSSERLTALVSTLLPFVSRYNLPPLNPTSATKVREALDSCDRSKLKASVGLPLVEAYLMALMNTRARC